MTDYSVSPDEFQIATEEILRGVVFQIEGKVPYIIEQTCRYVKDDTQANSPRRFGGYARSWRYKLTNKGKFVTGEVGNSKYPGLVHLLEKGHAKTGGGRVRPYVHLAPAAKSGEEMLIRLSETVIEEAIHG